MNDITRIHIAKIPYNIEPGAKRQLGEYLDELRTALGDDGIIDDIEIRITELLQERSVKADGTIDGRDITAVRKQLGEPSDFSDESDHDETVPRTNQAGRKFFRDPRGAWAGGILRGLATFSNLPVWLLRVLTAGLMLLSHGVIAGVYLVLWLVVPRAKTPADILRLEGRPVTAGNISSIGPVPKGNDAFYVRALRVSGGIASVLFALLTAAGTSLLAYMYNSPANYYGFRSLQSGAGYNLSSWHWALGAFIAFGVMTAAFFAVMAFSIFTKRLTRRIIVTAVILSVLALGLLISALVMVHTQERKYDSFLQQHTVTKKIDLPLRDFRSLVAAAPNGSFTYQITAGEPYAEYRYSDLTDKNSAPVIKSNEGTLEITFEQAHPGTDRNSYLTVYGPALKSIQVTTGSLDYIGNQSDLAVDLKTQTGLNLSGNISSLQGAVGSKANLNSSLDSEHNLGHVVLNVGDNAQVNLQAVAFLDIRFAETCSSDASVYVSVLGNKIGSLSINGKSLPAANAQAVCGTVYVDNTSEL